MTREAGATTVAIGRSTFFFGGGRGGFAPWGTASRHRRRRSGSNAPRPQPQPYSGRFGGGTTI